MDEEKDGDETGEDPKNSLQISDNDDGNDEDNVGKTSGNIRERSGDVGEGSNRILAIWSTVNSEPRVSET